MKEEASRRESKRNFLTSSVSFVLDFSRASTLAWRLLTDPLQIRNTRLVKQAAVEGGRRGLVVKPQVSVQLFDVVLLIQDRRDLTIAERAKQPHL